MESYFLAVLMEFVKGILKEAWGMEHGERQLASGSPATARGTGEQLEEKTINHRPTQTNTDGNCLVRK